MSCFEPHLVQVYMLMCVPDLFLLFVVAWYAVYCFNTICYIQFVHIFTKVLSLRILVYEIIINYFSTAFTVLFLQNECCSFLSLKVVIS